MTRSSPDGAGLLPCPFCGGRNIEIFNIEEGPQAGCRIVECYECFASTGARVAGPTQDDDLIKAWNTRAYQPAAPAQSSAGTVTLLREASKALDYLADHNRPQGGQSDFNAEHLIDLAYRLREAANGVAPAQSSADIEALLKDPVAVHINMLRGTIAKPTWENIKHLYPEQFNGVAQGWRVIDTAPLDEDVLLGWWRAWPELKWECASGLAGSSKGGWLHGQATHWQPLPAGPEISERTTPPSTEGK